MIENIWTESCDYETTRRKGNLYRGSMMYIPEKLRIGLFITITITLIVSPIVFTITYAQLEQFLDPNDPYNLTKVCNNYVNSPLGSRAPDAQIIVMCSDYLNQTMLDRFGLVE